ncbi:MAG: hypothetical protein ACQERC_02510 [Bacteroidota bacterium]
MNYITPTLEEALNYLDQLDPDQQPAWGKMEPQAMVEHLTDTLRIARGQTKLAQVTPNEELDQAYAFLMSDRPFKQRLKVEFAPEDRKLRHEHLSDAIDEFAEEWITYDAHYENSEQSELHPYFGNLNFDAWQQLNKKHLSHHFLQFELIE